jgi:hypothetical protein
VTDVGAHVDYQMEVETEIIEAQVGRGRWVQFNVLVHLQPGRRGEFQELQRIVGEEKTSFIGGKIAYNLYM